MLDSLHKELEKHLEQDTFRFKILNAISYYSYASPANTKKYAEEALHLAEELKFEKGIAAAQYMLSIYWMDERNYDQSLKYGLDAMRIYERTKHKKGIYNTTELIAGIYMNWNDYSKAQEYLQRMLTMAASDSNLADYGNLYHNLGITYNQQKKFTEGISYLKKALVIRKERKDWYGQSVAYCDIGNAQLEAKQFTEAEPNFYLALSAAKKVNNIAVLSIAHKGLGEIKMEIQSHQKAHVHFDTALFYAQKTHDRAALLKIYRDFSSLYHAEGNFKKALEFERLNRNLNDSIFNKEKADQLAEVQTRYETEKKEQTIQLLQRDKKIESLTKNILLAALILTIITAAVIFKIQRFREKKNRALLNLMIDNLTMQHKQLTGARHAGIQTSSLSIESHDDRFLKKALQIVEKYIADPLFGVEKMAEELSVSRTNLLRKLKSITGFPPSDFIRSVRLKRAAQLLSSQADSVAQIGFMVGFEDQSYFAKSFRRHFGVSPSEYGRITPEGTSQVIASSELTST